MNMYVNKEHVCTQICKLKGTRVRTHAHTQTLRSSSSLFPGHRGPGSVTSSSVGRRRRTGVRSDIYRLLVPLGKALETPKGRETRGRHGHRTRDS